MKLHIFNLLIEVAGCNYPFSSLNLKEIAYILVNNKNQSVAESYSYNSNMIAKFIQILYFYTLLALEYKESFFYLTNFVIKVTEVDNTLILEINVPQKDEEFIKNRINFVSEKIIKMIKLFHFFFSNKNVVEEGIQKFRFNHYNYTKFIINGERFFVMEIPLNSLEKKKYYLERKTEIINYSRFQKFISTSINTKNISNFKSPNNDINRLYILEPYLYDVGTLKIFFFYDINKLYTYSLLENLPKFHNIEIKKKKSFFKKCCDYITSWFSWSNTKNQRVPKINNVEPDYNVVYQIFTEIFEKKNFLLDFFQKFYDYLNKKRNRSVEIWYNLLILENSITSSLLNIGLTKTIKKDHLVKL